MSQAKAKSPEIPSDQPPQSEQAQAQAGAADLRAQLIAIADLFPKGLIVFDISGRMIYANSQVPRLLNRPIPVDHTINDYLQWDSRREDGVRYTLDELPMSRALYGQPVSSEIMRIGRPTDNTEVPVQVDAVPIRGAGDATAGVVMTLSEVATEPNTDVDALRRSDRQFRAIVENSRDFSIFMMDPAGIITVWNRGAERMLGYSEAEAIGRSGDMVFTAEDRAAGQPDLERKRAAEYDRAVNERWHVRKDGRRFWGSGVLASVRDPKGQLTGVVKVFQDKTDAKLAVDQLNEAKELADIARTTAEDANRVKDDFISTVSHELRTPLTVILTWLRLLRRSGFDPEEQLDALDAMERSANAQQQIIDDLLDVARMTAGKLRLLMRPTELKSVLRSAVAAIRPTAETKHIDLELDLSSDVVQVRADAERLQQVVWNLLSNAVKFTPNGGQVKISTRKTKESIEVSVIDTGQGIEPEFMPYLFERFRQADSHTTRRHGGLGLGLGIAKQLIELHGGSIAASSAGPGKGATFTIVLPLPDSPVADPSAPPPNVGATLPLGRVLAGHHLLLVEDEVHTRAAVDLVLRAGGAVVRAVGSVADAMSAIEDQRPDLLVSDIAMPDEDGYSLIERIRKQEQSARLPPLPALALSAFARPEDRDHALNAGFDDHLPKPFEPSHLVALCATLLRDRAKVSPDRE